MKAPIPPNEQERLEELNALNVVNSTINHQLEMITQIAARIFGTPIALVSLIDTERQWFKAKWGLETSETPRDYAFCAHAILDREPMVITNAVEDERFSDNPLVTGEPNIRFYAGAPLITQKGYPLGTLCVIDTKARHISEGDLKSLQQLSSLAVGILENVSRQTKLELEVTEEMMNKKQQELLISSLSHELRTPINHIIGFSQLMQTELTNDDMGIRHQGLLDIVRQSGEHLNRLIENLIRYEQSSFVDSLVLGPIELNAIIDDIVQTFSQTVAAKSQTLKFNEYEGPVSVLADYTSLRQILINLISNASKYAPVGGSITIDISSNGAFSDCSIEVRDDGPGMPRNVLADLGKPFVRGSNSGEVETEGFGLGLHITNRLCDAMNGSLVFTPNLGGGTCATVRLPLSM